MDLDRLSKGERIVGISSLLLLLCSFIPMWASFDMSTRGLGDADQSTSHGFNAWSAAYNVIPKLAIVLAILALALVVAKAVGANLPDMPVTHGLLYLGLAGLATLLLLLTVLFGPYEVGGDYSFGGVEAKAEMSRGLMLFVGLVLAAAATYGGYLHMQEEGAAPVGGTARPASPPPPPA